MEARAYNTVPSVLQVLSQSIDMKTNKKKCLNLNKVPFPLLIIFCHQAKILKYTIWIFILISIILILQRHVSMTLYIKSSSRTVSQHVA